jgi:hypothetical protein
MNKRFQIQYVSNNSGNLYPKGMKAYNQNSCAAGSLARKYNHCKKSGTSDVWECTMNPSCCPGKEEPLVVYSVAGGNFIDSQGLYQSFVTEEKNGQWRLPVTDVSFVNGYLGYYNEVVSIAASGYGYAVAGGYYSDTNSIDHAFVINQTANKWDNVATDISFSNPSQGSIVISVSSSSPGYAVAGGYYYDNINDKFKSFVINQTPNGWDNVATDISFSNTSQNSFVNSVSSSSPGYAVVGGNYTDTNGYQAFVINQTPKGWDNVATDISFSNPGFRESRVSSVSSSSPGYAVAGGNYTDANDIARAFVINQTPNGWDNVATDISFSNTSQDSYVFSVSSSSPGYAVVGGNYVDTNGFYQAFVINQTANKWDNVATDISFSNPSLRSEVDSVSSCKPGYAVAGGRYTDTNGFYQAFIINQTANKWDNVATDISFSNPSIYSRVISVSSSSPGYAVAGGIYKDANGYYQSFVIHQVNGIWQQPAIAITDSFSQEGYYSSTVVSSIATKKK